MRCPRCGEMRDHVLDSRTIQEGERIRRRRECVACHTRFTTYEAMEQQELRVVKRSGRTEPFHRYKLLSSLSKACEKRTIRLKDLEHLVDEIVLDLGVETEIPSHILGWKAMEKLQTLDPVAYVRFASVYRQFKDAGEFVEEIEQMRKRGLRFPNQLELFDTPSPATPQPS